MELKLLPSFLGGKARWTRHLSQFQGKRFVEPFSGSAAISFALSSPAPLWNELDPVLSWILSHFDEQIVPDVFTLEDYYRVRSKDNWARHAYCLTRMAFAGIFRYTQSGFNVPPDKRLEGVCLRGDYEKALARWRELRPRVTTGDWSKIPAQEYSDAIVVIDPPFKNSHAPYCHVPDYRTLWDAVRKIQDIAETVICFEYEDVLRRVFPNRDFVTRVSRPNGKRPVRTEAMCILHRGEPEPEVQTYV